MASAWYQVSCNIPLQIADSVAEYLADISGCGVCTENRNVDAFSTDEIPTLSTTTVTGYFPLPCQIEEHISKLEAFLLLQSYSVPSYPYSPVTSRIIEEEEWATSWRDLFKPLKTGQTLLVTPSWLPPKKGEERIVITIDPGMAFGTGGHETTMLCLECLERIITGRTDLFHSDNKNPAQVLDLGTGSGILAIAAAKLGASTVDAVDIDPQAVIVATENCLLNNVSGQVRCSVTPIERLDGRYGLILANILAEELVRLAPAIVARLETSGELVLSGILAERENHVTEGFKPYPLELDETLEAGEWRCLRYKRTK